jgi:hypothetical protein
MGLDWIVENKPKDNIEQYYKLKYKLNLLYDYDEFKKESTRNEIINKIKETKEQLKEYSITPQETLDKLDDNKEEEEEKDDKEEFFIGGSFLTSNHDFRGEIISTSELLPELLKEEAYSNHNSSINCYINNIYNGITSLNLFIITS